MTDTIATADRLEETCEEIWTAMRPIGGAFWHELDERSRALAVECFKAGNLEALALRTPSEGEGDDDDHMRKISEVIADLQSIQERFGDTCVYIRRGGMSWGAVALNRRDDDKKNGVFDLQAQHDRDMIARAQQVQRLVEDNRELRERLSSLQPKE